MAPTRRELFKTLAGGVGLVAVGSGVAKAIPAVPHYPSLLPTPFHGRLGHYLLVEEHPVPFIGKVARRLAMGEIAFEFNRCLRNHIDLSIGNEIEGVTETDYIAGFDPMVGCIEYVCMSVDTWGERWLDPGAKAVANLIHQQAKATGKHILRMKQGLPLPSGCGVQQVAVSDDNGVNSAYTVGFDIRAYEMIHRFDVWFSLE